MIKKNSFIKLFFLFSYILFISIFIYRIFNSFEFDFLSIISVLSIVILGAGLIYLAYYDFMKMEVHNVLSFVLMIVLLLLNILAYKVLHIDNEVLILGYYSFNPLSNLLAALILGLISQAIVVISKENALGQGDVRISIITGLVIGQGNLILWLYITILSAFFYALVIAKEKKSFRNIKIPFVPFMILGILLVIVLSL